MSRRLRDAGDAGNQNSIGQFNELAKIGTALGLLKRFVSGAVVTNVMVLPDDAKAGAIVSAYATVGTVTGVLTPVLGAPATTQVSITANGDIVFQATDAVTAAEVTYTTPEGQLITELITVTASVGTLLAGKSAALLVSASVVTGVVPGALTVDFRGLVPATGEVVIDDTGVLINFNAA
ncbi:MAG: hypothetical protein V3W06_00360, partial [Acidimicrobiia bacterium]